MRATIYGRTLLNRCSGITTTSRQAALIATLSLGFAGTSFAENYYINASEGDDAWSGKQSAASQANGPWKSLARIAGVNFQPGDNILLHCTSVWNEPLVIRAKGTATSRITIGPYGQCVDSRPIIRPTRSLGTPATSTEQTIPLDTAPQMVVIDNQMASRARFPAQGYLSLQQINGVWHLPLNGMPVSHTALTGADLVVRVNDYNIEERRLYDVEANGEFTVAKPFAQTIVRGAGAYLEGQPWMIAKPSQWAYNDANQQLHVRLANASAKVEVALPGNAITINNSEYLTLRGLGIVFAEQHGIEVNWGRNIRFEVMYAKDVGNSFVTATNSDGLVIDGFLGTRSQRNGIVARGNAVTVTNCDLSDIGVSTNIRKSVAAIELGYAVDAVITNNRIKRTGYSAIMFGKRARVENNSITDACTRLSDCGAIYTSGAKKNLGLFGASIRNNLIAGVPGNVEGGATKQPLTAGIYLDDESAGIVIENNHIEGAQRGIFSKAHSSRIVGNTLFGNERAIFLTNSGARGTGRADGTQLGTNRIISMGQQAPMLIVGTSADMPLASADNEYFWLPVGAKHEESWLGSQRSIASGTTSLAATTVIKRINQARSMVNAQETTTSPTCPLTASDCLKARLLSGQAATWPMVMSPKSATVVVIPK
jgi:hypothetical protein